MGCILGGAIGDAIGGPFEGKKGPISVGVSHAWRLSDDTQLTLATMEGLAAGMPVSPARIAERFAAWFREGRITGIGSSTLKAMRDLVAGAHWALAGAKGDRAAGNGAAMRAAPLAFVFDPHSAEDRVLLRDVCRITHHHEEAYVGALAVVLAIHAVAHAGVNDFVSAVADALPDSVVRDRLRAVAEMASSTSVVEVAGRIGCSGYVGESVPLALHAARCAASEGFEAVVLGAVSAGGDTDTIAAIAGQIAGAQLGVAGIPPEMLARIPGVDSLRAQVGAFAVLVNGGR